MLRTTATLVGIIPETGKRTTSLRRFYGKDSCFSQTPIVVKRFMPYSVTFRSNNAILPCMMTNLSPLRASPRPSCTHRTACFIDSATRYREKCRRLVASDRPKRSSASSARSGSRFRPPKAGSGETAGIAFALPDAAGTARRSAPAQPAATTGASSQTSKKKRCRRDIPSGSTLQWRRTATRP